MRINNLKSLAGITDNNGQNGYGYVTLQELQRRLDTLHTQSGFLSSFVQVDASGKISPELIPNISVSKVHIYTENDILATMSADAKIDALENRTGCFQLIQTFLKLKRTGGTAFNVGQLVMIKDTETYYQIQGTYIIVKADATTIQVQDFVFGTGGIPSVSGQVMAQPPMPGKLDITISKQNAEQQQFLEKFYRLIDYSQPGQLGAKKRLMFDGQVYVSMPALQAYISGTVFPQIDDYFGQIYDDLNSRIETLSGLVMALSGNTNSN